MSQTCPINARVMRSTDFYKSDGIRLINPSTGRYLHLSGKGEVSGTTYAWRGFVKQARVLRDRAQTRGEEWPYRMETVKA